MSPAGPPQGANLERALSARAIYSVRRAFQDTAVGAIHYATAGEGPPVLLLHQTPRSWDEYRDVIPILARERRAIAMDTLGYGDSHKPTRRCGIEDYARGAVALLDALEVDAAAVVGHHTGAVIAMELAATYPHRVERLVLSASPWLDAAAREARKGKAIVDHVEAKPDGSHVAELWQQRQRFYPKDRDDLLHRFVVDALKAGEKLKEGHEACSNYRMEERIGRVRCPTLVTCGTEDPFSHPKMTHVARAIPGSRVEAIRGGSVAVVDEMPEAFAALVLRFLREGC
jgi:pimeloyl-ACP methyl ester carboxylesterase